MKTSGSHFVATHVIDLLNTTNMTLNDLDTCLGFFVTVFASVIYGHLYSRIPAATKILYTSTCMFFFPSFVTVFLRLFLSLSMFLFVFLSLRHCCKQVMEAKVSEEVGPADVAIEICEDYVQQNARSPHGLGDAVETEEVFQERRSFSGDRRE